MTDHRTAAEAVLRLTRWWSMNDVWDCGMAYTIGPTFEEAYEIRAALIADKVLGLGQVRQVAHSFSERALSTQGVAEENMFYMGYAANRNEAGIPNCSCVADACSSAAAILDTVKAFPDSAMASEFVGSVSRFADYVLEKYADENGVMGVGILGHQINPWKQYWCACALLVQVLIDLHALTGETRYLDAAVPQLEYLAAFDYKNTSCNCWSLAPTEVIMYAGEGIVKGLQSSEICNRLASRKAPFFEGSCCGESEAVQNAALNQVKAAESGNIVESTGAPMNSLDLLKRRWLELGDWLYRNQEITGIWQEAKDYRCYQLGIGWLLCESAKVTGMTPEMARMIDRQLACMIGPEGITYHGLFCRPFATALAHFSAARAAQMAQENDPDQFEIALKRASIDLPSAGW